MHVNECGQQNTHELYSISTVSSTSKPTALFVNVAVASAEVASANTAQAVPMALTADDASIMGVMSFRFSFTVALHEKADGLPPLRLSSRRRAIDRVRVFGRRVAGDNVIARVAIFVRACVIALVVIIPLRLTRVVVTYFIRTFVGYK